MLAEVCLALNMYHEARGEGPVGMVAIGQTTLNRVADPRWPNDICKVVKERGFISLNSCQFSWYCDRRSDVPVDKDMWNIAISLSRGMIKGHIASPKLKDATCYHATWVENLPKWTLKSKYILTEGDHIFYAC